MNYNTKRIFVCIIEILIGITLTVLGVMGKVDSYWSGMGGALIAVGAVLLIKHLRILSNAEYREKQTTELQDERNRFLSTKAWSWAGYLYVMGAAVASIALRVTNHPDLSTFAGLSVCAIMVFYWLSWLWLRKKY